MSEETARKEILFSLERYHSAQKAGDLATILEMFTQEPQYVTHGLPQGPEALRQYFESMISQDRYASLEVDMSRLWITVDTTSEFAKTPFPVPSSDLITIAVPGFSKGLCTRWAIQARIQS